MSQDITTAAKNFDDFIAEWSGLNTLVQIALIANNQNLNSEREAM